MATANRDDCGVQTLALLRRSPDAHGFVGACIVCGGRSLLTLEAVPGMLLPWSHHVWAIGTDGEMQDLTADGLMPEGMRSWYQPPAPLEQMRPVIVWDRAAQDAAIGKLRPLAVPDSAAFEQFESCGDLLYLPGRVGKSLSRSWQRLARKSQTPTGFGAADLASALEQRPRRTAQGFGLGVP